MPEGGDACPVCNAPFVHSITAESFRINHSDAKQDRTCATLLNGEIGVYYHTAENLMEPESVPDADPEELEGARRIVYKRVHEATASSGSILLRDLVGKAGQGDVPPGEVREIASGLVEEGYMKEIADAVYRAEEPIRVGA